MTGPTDLALRADFATAAVLGGKATVRLWSVTSASRRVNRSTRLGCIKRHASGQIVVHVLDDRQATGIHAGRVAMKTIGIIGGLGPPSTLKYYEWLAEGAQQRTSGASHGARVMINALDGKDVWAFRQAGDQDGEGHFFAKEALRLERAGADCILIASNTSHKNAPWVERAVEIPLIHLAKVTACAALQAGHSKVVVLGTATTLEGSFYTGILRDAGLEVAIPTAGDRAYISDAIYHRLVRNIVDASDVSRIADITKSLVEMHHADAVVLGCTELTLLSLPEALNIPFHDTIRIHVEAALDFAFSS